VLEMRSVLATSLLLLTAAVGCSNSNKPQQDASANRSERPVQDAPSTATPLATQPAAATPAQPVADEPQGQQLPDPLRGTVKETMNVGGYSYLLLETAHGEVWAAARQLPVAVGNEVEIAGLMPMVNFSSPSLKRTFDVIQFVGQAQVVGGDAAAATAATPGQAPPLQPGQEMPPGHPPIGQMTPTQPGPSGLPEPGDIEAMADGVTVAQLFEKKAELDGKPVKFRGRVVKANSGILGKNWMHIQDGTGAAGTNDITVTSETGFAPKGSLVVIEGTLGLDRDFGAGYSYAVIVENANVVVEQAETEQH